LKSLYLRIWLTVISALALFALVSGWLVNQHLERERLAAESEVSERMVVWGDLIENSLPAADAPLEDQTQAIRDWSRKLRVPLALDDKQGQRIVSSGTFLRRISEPHRPGSTAVAVTLADGRRLWMMRPQFGRQLLPEPGNLEPGRRPGVLGPGNGPEPEGLDGPGGRGRRDGPGLGPGSGWGPGPEVPHFFPWPTSWPAGIGLATLLAMLFLAVAAGAYPVVRGLTRRLELLKLGVERFGEGALEHRVPVTGNDEVALVASSFNRAAARIQALVLSNQSLLANASHELRSPLARLKMAVSMLQDLPPARHASLHAEINTNIRELDALVEEVLLSSRLEADAPLELDDGIDLLGLLAEEGARVGAEVDGPALVVRGNDRLLRRAVRNLLENAQRYGGNEISAGLDGGDHGPVVIRICDRGPGVPASERERIFEPFYRMPGHAEREGGVGLGLALVEQIARRHGGRVHCEARAGGGSCFVITLPAERRRADAAPIA
jgi:signal transduction histidine kinase